MTSTDDSKPKLVGDIAHTSRYDTTQPTDDSELTEILEDFAENLASAKEEDSVAQIILVVKESVDKAKSQLKQLILKDVLELLPKAWDEEKYGQLNPEDFKSGFRMGREDYEGEFRQSARKRYQS